jgi:hypothetical protein
MKKVSPHLVGVDQGDVVLFSDYEHDGDMWAGSGPRQMRAHVVFDTPYVSAPAVIVNLSMWDMSNAANARADVQAEDVTENGFAILFRTWGDTKIARVRVSWMSVGPVRDDDDWDV